MVSNAQTGPCLRHLLDSIHALKRQRKLQLTAIAALWSLLPAVVILFAAAGLDVLHAVTPEPDLRRETP